MTLDCRNCGACCAFSADWPQFIGDRDGDGIPAALVDPGRRRMRCAGDRCAALAGRVGERVACTVYASRPLVCRELQPGDADCRLARAAFGLPPDG